MRILCVAEKPSAAKKIAEILSQNRITTRPTDDVHIKNYDFTYIINGRPTSFTMTALKGHLLSLKFEGDINHRWHDYPIDELFDHRVIKYVDQKFVPIADNLKREIRQADALFVWTDCDREGEAIGGDLADLCRSVKPSINVWRAHFSAMQPQAINYAAQHHVEIDMKQVEAVRARSELDLRIGAAFTRLQTINLKNFFQMNDKKIVSYGSCQFPTLGFVVDRYQQVENFIPEDFWKITMTYAVDSPDPKEKEKIETSFNWRRGHLFDRWACLVLFEKCYEKKIAKVTKVLSKQTSKWKPLPLTTVEMQKAACKALRLSGSRIMQLAEELYTAGLISYPRTETDQFDAGFDFMSLINTQTSDPTWGQYAQILRDGEFQIPRNGKNNDKAHPPIHPTSYDASLSGDKRRVYEFITRRFLACCWKNAVGYETTVEVQLDTEFFDTKGLVILERNYLEVYPYDKWTGHRIPEFQQGHEFVPTTLNMEAGKTSPPKLLTESDLIGLMEKNEIGTDATIAEHIQKILDRHYVYKEREFFKPLTLGIALVLGYDQIGLEQSLSKPFLRRQMEADLKSICDGMSSPRDVLGRSVSRYKEMFYRLKADFSKIRQSMERHFHEAEDENLTSGSNHGGGGGGFDGSGGSNGQNDDGSSRGGRGGRGRGTSTRGTSGTNTRGSRGSSTRGRGARGGGSRSTTNGNHGPTSVPNCEGHGKPMVKRTTQKEGPNKGRDFFVCTDTSDQCNTFKWADEVDDNSNSSNNSTPQCNCGKHSVIKKVQKEGLNKGRDFYTCESGRDGGCGFFEWA